MSRHRFWSALSLPRTKLNETEARKASVGAATATATATRKECLRR